VQECSYLRNQGIQPLFVGAYDCRIIDISAVGMAMQNALHELVEDVQINIREQLRGEIADWKS